MTTVATHGPVPKRSTERRRRNADSVPTKVKVTAALKVKAPRLPAETHPIARRWYRALTTSGQSKFFEPSDWAAALLLAAELTRMLEGRFSAMAFAALWSAMGDLGTTEAARRRVRIEIERPDDADEAEAAGVAMLDQYREALGG